MQRAHQNRKGCFGEMANPVLQYRGDPDSPMGESKKITYYKCPSQFFSPYWANIINMHGKFERGVMPFPGSLMEQPALIVETFNLVHNLKEETKIKLEKTLKKIERHGKK